MAWHLAWILVFLAGCGPQAMKKGAGASGTSSTLSVDESDLGLDLINRLSAGQKRAFDYLHRPFGDAVTVGEQNEPAAKELLGRLEAAWGDVEFANVEKNERYFPSATIVTNHGSIPIQLGETRAPDLARNFVALARLDYFNGKKVRLAADGTLRIGDANDAPYSLDAQNQIRILRDNVVVMRPTDGKIPGVQLDLVLKRPKTASPDLCVVGLINSSEATGKIVKALQADPDSAWIERVETDRTVVQLFVPGGVQLPTVTERGLIPDPLLDGTAVPIPRNAKSKAGRASKTPAPQEKNAPADAPKRKDSSPAPDRDEAPKRPADEAPTAP